MVVNTPATTYAHYPRPASRVAGVPRTKREATLLAHTNLHQLQADGHIIGYYQFRTLDPTQDLIVTYDTTLSLTGGRTPQVLARVYVTLHTDDTYDVLVAYPTRETIFHIHNHYTGIPAAGIADILAVISTATHPVNTTARWIDQLKQWWRQRQTSRIVQWWNRPLGLPKRVQPQQQKQTRLGPSQIAPTTVATSPKTMLSPRYPRQSSNRWA